MVSLGRPLGLRIGSIVYSLAGLTPQRMGEERLRLEGYPAY
jgi:hypothetical protein